MSDPLVPLDPKQKILAILADNREMAIATLRPDGWPQTTIVGYIYDDLTLYFAVGRTSQKAVNIERDPRVSIAIGRRAEQRIRGLSMAARCFPVGDMDEVANLNRLIRIRYPEQALFSPREASSVIFRVTPKIISIIDLTDSPGQPLTVEVSNTMSVHAPI